MFLNEVHCHFANSGTSNDDCCAGVCQRLYELSQLVLLAAAVICELLGVLDEYCALLTQQPTMNELLSPLWLLYQTAWGMATSGIWSASPPMSASAGKLPAIRLHATVQAMLQITAKPRIKHLSELSPKNTQVASIPCRSSQRCKAGQRLMHTVSTAVVGPGLSITLVSVELVSMPWANTATFAAVARLTVPSAPRCSTIPRTTEESATPPPLIFTTRTLSTLKLAGFLGHTDTHACTHTGYVKCTVLPALDIDTSFVSHLPRTHMFAKFETNPLVTQSRTTLKRI